MKNLRYELAVGQEGAGLLYACWLSCGLGQSSMNCQSVGLSYHERHDEARGLNQLSIHSVIRCGPVVLFMGSIVSQSVNR